MGAGVEQEHPGSVRAVEVRFHPLPVVPARDLDDRPGHRKSADVGVRPPAQPLSHSRQHSTPTGGAGRQHDRGGHGTTQGLGCGRIGGITGLRKVGTRDREEPGGAARANLACRGIGGFTDQADVPSGVAQATASSRAA